MKNVLLNRDPGDQTPPAPEGDHLPDDGYGQPEGTEQGDNTGDADDD